MKNKKIRISFLAIILLVMLSSCGTSPENILGSVGGADLAGDAEKATDTAVAELTKSVKDAEETQVSIQLTQEATQRFRDASGDEVICAGGDVTDNIVDIRSITAFYTNLGRVLTNIEVEMGSDPVDSISYAVIVIVNFEDGSENRAFIYEIHEGVEKIGEIDLSGNIIKQANTGDGFDIIGGGTVVYFDFAAQGLLPFIEGFVESIDALSFHTLNAGDDKNCDEADTSQAAE